MKNERPNAGRNLLKRVRYRPEHKAPKQKIEVAISDLHRNCTDYIGINHAVSGNVPAAAVPQGEWRGVGEVERDSQIRTITLVIVTLSL